LDLRAGALKIPANRFRLAREEPMRTTRRSLPIIIAAVMLASAAFARSPEIYAGIVPTTAVGGYDPVAYFTDGKPVSGKKELTFSWKGATWRFANEKNLEAFKASPERYAPQYGGYCAWAVSQGYTAKGRSQGVEDRRRQALSELRRRRAEELGERYSRQHRQGRQELAPRPGQIIPSPGLVPALRGAPILSTCAENSSSPGLARAKLAPGESETVRPCVNTLT
jgi:YHS domain-containing protein